ncbi:MAG: hypothetical protein RSE15_08295 [Flavobacterium sp.]|uniref:hypothetical protein n=1 Tax=Flavobacterium sp. TaxID=239 RepID=UPI002B495205|nr:hypothetical protein [Flavobacterium sp.]WRH72364.1 MAG: hypothetical protein RSE15_08295 [Flavobacterium sp.]
MQKLILLTFFSFFILSCAEKEKTYEELEAEVLCDVLPEVIYPFIQINLPPPPPPSSDSTKIILDNDFIIKDIERQTDEIKKLVREKHKIHVGLNFLMFSINKSEFKTINRNNIAIDSLMERKFRPNELLDSTLKVKFFENDTIAIWGEFIKDSEIKALSSVTRVLFDDKKTKAFFKLYPFGCLPYSIEVVSEKVNNKWVVKEIIKE